MAFQLSGTVRDAQANALGTVLATGVLKIFSGAVPANCAAADPSGALLSLTGLSVTSASGGNGQIAKSGTWSGSASGTGTAASFRLYATGGTTCHLQGSVTATGGGGDMTLDNTSIASGQTVTISTWSYTAGNS